MKTQSKALIASLCIVLSASACSGPSTDGDASGSGGQPGSSGSTQSGKDLGTIKPGSISVAYTNGYMPYAGVQNGKLTGVEGELFLEAAKTLGQNVQVSGMEFPALLAGIQSRRYDIGIGGIGWSKDRAATGPMSDPLYYSPTVAMCRPGVVVHTIDDLKGLRIGTVTGTNQDKGVRGVQGAKPHTYPTSQAALQDLTSGRVDCISVDTLTVAYTRKKRPDLKKYKIFPIAQPTAAQVKKSPNVEHLGPYMVVWYCGKSEKTLCNTVSKLIDKWYKSGVTVDALKKWGAPDPAGFMKPTADLKTERRGVDRPMDWVAPSS